MDWPEFMAQFPAPATIGIEETGGAAGYGDRFDALVEVSPCFVEYERKRVRVSTQDAAGAEVVSSAQAYCPPSTGGYPNSRVTLPNGTVTKVLQRKVFDAGGLDLPEHVTLLLE